MKTVATRTESNTQIKTEIPLPSLIEEQIKSVSERALDQFNIFITNGSLCVTVTKADEKIGCDVVLFSSDGIYMGYSEDYDPCKALMEGLGKLNAQILSQAHGAKAFT